MKLALAALASVPSASAPRGSVDAAPPPSAPATPDIPAPRAQPLPLDPSPSLSEPAASSTFHPPPRPSATDEVGAVSSPLPPRPSPPAPVPAAAAPAPATTSAAAPKAVDQPQAPALALETPSGASAAPSDQADQDSFASVESLIHRLRAAHRHDTTRTASAAPAAPAYQRPPGERLARARALLASGEADHARRLLEAAATQLLLGSGEAYPTGSSAATQIDDALRWIGAGQPARAISLVDAAIATLDQGRGASALPTDRRFATQVPPSGPDSGLW